METMEGAIAHGMDFSYFDQVHGTLPLQAAQEAMGRFLRSWPGETESPETPPGLRRRRLDLLDYEQVLGRYDVETRGITLWTQGIDAVVERLRVAPLLLRRIVRLHESAHAVHHLGYLRASSGHHERSLRDEARAQAVFPLLSDDAREQVAQLATLVALKAQAGSVTQSRALVDVEAAIAAFVGLMRMQSAIYRLSEAVVAMDVSRLSGKLDLILGLLDSGLRPTPEQVELIMA